MAVTRVVLCLALAALVAVNAAPTQRFVDFIESGSSAKVQSAYETAYEEVESTSVCLQQVGDKFCSCLHGDETSCTRGTTCVKLACCKSLDGDKYSNAVEDLMAEQTTVGSCTYTEEYFHDEITYRSSDATKVGIFQATCELVENSNTCGEPLCDGMSLHVSGDILSYGKVAFMHSIVTTPDGDHCPLSFPQSTKKTTPVKTESYKDKDTSDDGVKFETGPGRIYSGVFYVVSREHKTSYKTGQFQMIKHIPGGKYEVSPAPPEKCFVAKDGAIALDFYKSGSYY